jgi:hypothetical protein
MFFVLLCLIIKWNSFFTWWSAWYDLIVYFWTNGCPSFHEISLCFRVAYGVLGRAHDRPAFAVEYSRMHFGPHHCFEPNYGTFPTILLWFIVFPCKIRSRVIKHIARLVSFGVAVLNYCLSELADDLFIDEIQFVLYAHLRKLSKKKIGCLFSCQFLPTCYVVPEPEPSDTYDKKRKIGAIYSNSKTSNATLSHSKKHAQPLPRKKAALRKKIGVVVDITSHDACMSSLQGIH